MSGVTSRLGSCCIIGRVRDKVGVLLQWNNEYREGEEKEYDRLIISFKLIVNIILMGREVLTSLLSYVYVRNSISSWSSDSL